MKFSFSTFLLALPTAASLRKVADYPHPDRRLTVEEDIINATAEIWSLIENQVNLAPKFVRLGFHDCVGGCNGCVDMNNADNAGLDIPIDALAPVVDTYESDSGLSRADIWALAYITGSNFANPDSDTFFTFNEYGRVNCAENDPTGGPEVELPLADIDTQDVLDFFTDAFGFDEQETCAILGAHTIGKVHQENSGFVGDRGWSNNKERLDNNYYAQIVGEGDTEEDQFEAPDWDQEEIINGNGIPDRFIWDREGGGGGGGGGGSGSNSRDGGLSSIFRHGGGFFRRPLSFSFDCLFDSNSNDDDDDIIMLNADIALVRTFGSNLQDDGQVSCDFRGRDACPAASTLSQMAVYRNDNDLWLTDFKAASEKMLVQGCDSCVSL